LIVGDKNQIALEYKIGPTDDDAELFLYLSNCRFGEEDNRYNYKIFINQILVNFEKPQKKFQAVFDVPGSILLDAVIRYGHYQFDDSNESVEFEHRITTLIPQFHEIADDLDECVFRYVGYTFDSCFILIVPDLEKIKVCALDQETDIYAEAITTYEDFIELWKELGAALDSV